MDRRPPQSAHRPRRRQPHLDASFRQPLVDPVNDFGRRTAAPPQQALLDWLPSVPALELVLDVWEGEPLVDAGLLARCRFGTPHIAGYSYDAKLRATHMLYLALCRNLGVEASGEEPPIEPVSVTIPAQCEGVELLRHLLGDVYDIREDDSSLRAVVPDSFDQLRRDYRRRRELGALHIENTQALSEEARQLCLALTCKPD